MKEREHNKILFISHEMNYTGAPRSLLRMCKVAKTLGYAPTVWTMCAGPFEKEYAAEGLEVETVAAEETDDPRRLKSISGFDMAVCNTVITARFARACCQRVPTVWYIREAGNMGEILKNSPAETAFILRNSRDIVCTSEYSAKAIRPYISHPVRVIHNCVEDEALLAEPHAPGSGTKVRFIQPGTLEERKGCDVLLSAFEALPPELRRRAELVLAGPGADTDFGREMLSRAGSIPGVRYMGVITDARERIRTLSRMDVVVLASRDEAGSLVPLEGAMLGKPLIVTKNIGTKYIVGAENGFVTVPGDPASLMRAMARCIEEPERLAPMGFASRRRYETMASMGKYTGDMKELFSLSETKGTPAFRARQIRNVLVFRGKWKLEKGR